MMYRSNQIVAQVLKLLRVMVEPGISTMDLDQVAERELLKRGATPAFKGYHGFPAALCVSINEEIVHGIPSSRRKLREGDIVSLDLGAKLEGYIGDSAITVGVGRISHLAKHLLDTTEGALYAGIAECHDGNRICDVSRSIQTYVESRGFAVVRELVGHGVGRELHEAPQVPNYYDERMRARIRPGMVIALEPMVVEGDWRILTRSDGWTAVTYDGKLSAHFEHSVAVTRSGPQILSKLAEPVTQEESCMQGDRLHG